MVGLSLGGRNRALASACVVPVLVANSAQAQFSTIINSPPTMVGDGLHLGSDTQLNLYEGGRIGKHVRAGQYRVPYTNIEVNITGGTVGDNRRVFESGRVEISGGFFEGTFGAYAGGQVIVSGGSFGGDFPANEQSRVTLSGGNFRLAGDTVSLVVPESAWITGVFADGTPFAFHSRDRDIWAGLFLRRHLRRWHAHFGNRVRCRTEVGPAIITALTDAVPSRPRDGVGSSLHPPCT